MREVASMGKHEMLLFDACEDRFNAKTYRSKLRRVSGLAGGGRGPHAGIGRAS